MSNYLVEIDVEEVRRTEKAILVRDADDKEIWLPLIQIEITQGGDLGKEILKIEIPKWLATDKGLV